jgi:hypothetical protein
LLQPGGIFPGGAPAGEDDAIERPARACPQLKRILRFRRSPAVGPLPGLPSSRFPLVRRHRTRNGADKTTMVQILATWLRPDAGMAIVAWFDATRR